MCSAFFLESFSLVIVVHQSQLLSLFMHIPEFQGQMAAGSGAYFEQFTTLSTQFDGAFRTFSHGAMHGGVVAFFVVLPVMATNALFERKSAKYVFVNVGYWFVTLMVMGGILCQWG